ncbi:MAG: DUF1772 domain-containing protein [Gammaproteobacteria bacterium]|nr:DUF1772 domain-containing protein [Gammaproteobacteria bacterium]
MGIQILQFIESLIQLSMIIMVGLYFIFSNTVMASLVKFESGADVMVEINKVILNPVFMAVFWISGLGSLYLVIVAEGFLFISGLVFLVGTTLVTMVRNVPLNNQLQDAGAEREQVWQRYLDKWVFWNHVRTVAATSSGLLLVV